jgi:hypothetical protein
MSTIEQLQQEYTGDGRPWFLRANLTPRYNEFRVDWKDASGRQYMRLDEKLLAVRLPIRSQLQPPEAGDALELIKPGDGHILRVVVVEVAARRRAAAVYRLTIL